MTTYRTWTDFVSTQINKDDIESGWARRGHVKTKSTVYFKMCKDSTSNIDAQWFDENGNYVMAVSNDEADKFFDTYSTRKLNPVVEYARQYADKKEVLVKIRPNTYRRVLKDVVRYEDCVRDYGKFDLVDVLEAEEEGVTFFTFAKN